MDRKKIIIEEIKYWKKSRLLPEQYCNFLLTLYSEGEETGQDRKIKSTSSQLWLIVIVTIGLALFGLSFLVIYFTDFSPVLQTSLTFIFSMLLFFLAYIVKRFDFRFVHLFILIGALMSFLTTIHGVSTVIPGNYMAIIIAVTITCFAWIFIGKLFRINYLFYSGIVGLVIVLYFLFA